jgi:hypothetical protein
MEQHFRLTIGKGTKFCTFHLSIKRGRRNSKSRTCFFGVDIRCLRMKYLSLSCLPKLTSNLSWSACFLCGMGITSCKLSCLILTIYTMMNLHGTFLFIPLSLTPFMMGLWTPHYHDKAQQVYSWTFFVLHRFKWFCSHYFLCLYRLEEQDHLKPNLVHEFFKIQLKVQL